MIVDTIRSVLGRWGSGESVGSPRAETYICAGCLQTFESLYRVCPECSGLVVPQDNDRNSYPYTL